MTGPELIDNLNLWMKKNKISLSELGFGEFSFDENDEDLEEDEKEFLAQFGKVTYTLCAERLSDGDHDTARTVILFKHHDVYLALDGYYDSHNGTDFSYASFYEVEPVQVTYTDYQKKK